MPHKENRSKAISRPGSNDCKSCHTCVTDQCVVPPMLPQVWLHCPGSEWVQWSCNRLHPAAKLRTWIQRRLCACTPRIQHRWWHLTEPWHPVCKCSNGHNNLQVCVRIDISLTTRKHAIPQPLQRHQFFFWWHIRCTPPHCRMTQKIQRSPRSQSQVVSRGSFLTLHLRPMICTKKACRQKMNDCASTTPCQHTQENWASFQSIWEHLNSWPCIKWLVKGSAALGKCGDKCNARRIFCLQNLFKVIDPFQMRLIIWLCVLRQADRLSG